MLAKKYRVPVIGARQKRGIFIQGNFLTLKILSSNEPHPRIGVFIKGAKNAVLRNALKRGILRAAEKRWTTLSARDYIFTTKKGFEKKDIKTIQTEVEHFLTN